MLQIFTASWFTALPDHVKRIGISRGTPRRQPAGYRMLRDLAPGPWFKSVTPGRYLDLYNEQLAGLDPQVVVDRLTELAEGKPAVAMLCFESARDCQTGDKWCHRHIASQWLRDTLGIPVEEFGVPGLDPWALLRNNGIEPPRYDRHGRAQAGPRADLSPYIGKRAKDANGETWEVVGNSEQHPDQAELKNVDTGELRTASMDVIRSKFDLNL